MSKVTQREIIDALNAYGNELKKIGFVKFSSQTIQERIQQHGIQVDYVPLSDEQVGYLSVFEGLHDVECPKLFPYIRYIEQAVLNRLGVAPTLDQVKTICEHNGLEVVDCGTKAELKRLQLNNIDLLCEAIAKPTPLDQARAICEANGFSVVPSIMHMIDESVDIPDALGLPEASKEVK